MARLGRHGTAPSASDQNTRGCVVSGFDVDPQQLRQVGLLTQQASTDMRTNEITPARSGHDQLLPTWEGVDQVQYKTYLDQILATGDTLVERLETVGILLLTAESTYAEAQGRQSGNFNRISDVLNG